MKYIVDIYKGFTRDTGYFLSSGTIKSSHMPYLLYWENSRILGILRDHTPWIETISIPGLGCPDLLGIYYMSGLGFSLLRLRDFLPGLLVQILGTFASTW